MTKKEPLKFKLTDEQLCEIEPLHKIIIGLRAQSMDIAFNIGRLDAEMWEKVREFFPEVDGLTLKLNWATGEVTEEKDC